MMFVVLKILFLNNSPQIVIPVNIKNLRYNKKKIPNILNHEVVDNAKQPFSFPKFTRSKNLFNQNKFSLCFIHVKMNQNTTNPKI